MLLAISIASSIALSECGVAWADDLHPFFLGPGPESLATTRHFNEHDASRLMAGIGAQVSHCELILQGHEQAMKAFFGCWTLLERGRRHNSLQFSPLNRP